MSDLTERLDEVLKLPLPTEGFDAGVANTTVIAYRSLLSEANEKIKKLTAENEAIISDNCQLSRRYQAARANIRALED